MLSYPFAMVLNPKISKKKKKKKKERKKDIPMYAGSERIFRRDLNVRPSEDNLPLMPNSNHVYTGIKSLCSKIAVSKSQ